MNQLVAVAMEEVRRESLANWKGSAQRVLRLRKGEGDAGVSEPWATGLPRLRQGRWLGSRFGGRPGFTVGRAGLE